MARPSVGPFAPAESEIGVQRRLRANFEKKSETLLNLDSMSPRRSWVKTIRITIASMQTLQAQFEPCQFSHNSSSGVIASAINYWVDAKM